MEAKIGFTEAGAEVKRKTAVRPVRVVYVSPGGVDGRGGMGIMARYLVHAFVAKESGVSCQVLDSYGPGRFALMPLYFAVTLLRLTWLCLTRRVDVVHVHMSHAGSAVRKLALLHLAAMFGVPTILHLHGSQFALFAKGLSTVPRQVLLRAMRGASRIVVIGNYWRDLLVDTLGLPATRIVIIHNGVPLPALTDRSTHRAPWRILCLGLLGPRKGTPDLLQALAAPALADLDWRATIAGNGDVALYQSEANRLGLADRVELPGWVGPDAVARLLGEADIFILPSYNEGLPVAVLEAMAAGLAVITTPVGAIPDLVTPEETGLLVEPGAVAKMSAMIARLLTDTEFRRRLGERARQRVEVDFTVQATADRLAALYLDISKAHRPASRGADLGGALGRSRRET
jgi:glycosyltransferase involved in cell wall biosynthesis